MDILNKYAQLLVHYCLDLKPNDRLYVSTTMLAEPLLREVYRVAIKAGAHVEYNMAFADNNKIFLDNAQDHQLDHVSPFTQMVMESFDAYLVIRAPFNLREDTAVDKDKHKRRSKALEPINTLYFERTANKSMRRCLCQYPTQASAQEAGMSLEEYQHFVFNACKLFDDNATDAWLAVRASQQHVVDYLNKCDQITYKNQHTNISFSVKDRIWINSDGRNNMPSGEVFTSPVENSVNGTVFFDYPSIYNGTEVRDIKLEVKDGQIIHWEASMGQAFLDHIMEIEGTRFFGEVAIGTNYDIQRITKNILFDEKIGGSIHMAIGQSYLQTGGKNKSTVHWDMIANMKEDGQIIADGKLIYQNGKFLI